MNDSVFLTFFQSFEQMRADMLTKGRHFLEKMSLARAKVASLGSQHISDSAVPALILFFSISLRPAFPCQISLPSHFRTIFRAINRQCVAYCITIQNFLTKVISRTRNQSNETIRVLIRVKSSCLLLLLFARVASFGIQKFKLLSTVASLSAPPS